IAQATRTQAFRDGQLINGPRRRIEEPGYIAQEWTVELTHAATLVLEKIASFYSSRDHAISECSLEARKAIARAGRFEAVMAPHVRFWRHFWHRFDIHIEPARPTKLNSVMLLRWNMLHLLQTISVNSLGLDMGVPARGRTAGGARRAKGRIRGCDVSLAERQQRGRGDAKKQPQSQVAAVGAG